RFAPASMRPRHSFPTRRSSDLVPKTIRVAFIHRPNQKQSHYVFNFRIQISGIGFSSKESTNKRTKVSQIAGFFRLFDHRKHETSDRKSTRLNSSHVKISYAVFC